MRELLILSGKGGTGKTTIAASFIKLSNARAYADCDVDAPNLHLLVKNYNNPLVKDYYGMDKACIKSSMCISCGRCYEMCRFDGIKLNSKNVYEIDIFSCEGCGLCEYICPANAIKMNKYVDGETMLYKNYSGVFSTAELKMGSGTSGMLVSEVKKNLRENTKRSEFAIIDGSPGIGCPVISSISGVDMVLVVAEASVSGFSDMKRVIEASNKLATRALVCINKYDINTKISDDIEKFCRANEITFVGKISFDYNLLNIMKSGGTIIDVECSAKYELEKVFDKTMRFFNEGSF